MKYLSKLFPEYVYASFIVIYTYHAHAGIVEHSGIVHHLGIE